MPGIQLIGNAGIIAEVESAQKSLRVVQSPRDPGALGSYGVGVVSGVMAAGLAANSEIFQFRWTNASNSMVLRSVTIGAGGIVAFAAGVCTFGLRVARTWSADGTGGTALSFATHDQKRRTSMGTTLAPTALGVRAASTAALGAGTKTLDGNDFSTITGSVGVTAGTPLVNPSTALWMRNTADEYPLFFAASEGFVIRATVPATGTWTFSVSIEWAEVANGTY